MDQKYVFTKDEILSFAKRIYAEACGGYMDLCDSSTEGMTEEFLAGKEQQNFAPSAWLQNTYIGGVDRPVREELYVRD